MEERFEEITFADGSIIHIGDRGTKYVVRGSWELLPYAPGGCLAGIADRFGLGAVKWHQRRVKEHILHHLQLVIYKLNGVGDELEKRDYRYTHVPYTVEEYLPWCWDENKVI